jgi:hypothetical protein
MKKPQCQQVKFDHKDGEDKANVPSGYTFKMLPFSDQYTPEGKEYIKGFTMGSFSAVFGAGERRPLEHNTWDVWRFKHNDTYLRVGIPRLPTHSPCVHVEAPEGINESLRNERVRQNVQEFMVMLLADLNLP